VRQATGGTELLNMYAHSEGFPEFNVTPYDLRHFVSTWGAEQGGDFSASMPGMMAHSKLTRERFYNHYQGNVMYIFDGF
jgi:hypothetical protein